MNKNLHDDQFEEFFRNKLNEFDDSPTSDMWERIDGVIPPKPKPTIVKYFTPISIAASFLLVVGLWAAVAQYRTKNEALSKKLEKAEQKIEILTNKAAQEKSRTIVLPQQEKEVNNLSNKIPLIDENEETIVENKAINQLDKAPIVLPKSRNNRKKINNDDPIAITSDPVINKNKTIKNTPQTDNPEVAVNNPSNNKNTPQNNDLQLIDKPVRPIDNIKHNQNNNNKQVVDRNPNTPKSKIDVNEKVLAKEEINPLDLKEMTAFEQALAVINENKLVAPFQPKQSFPKSKGQFSVTFTTQAVWEDRDFKRKGSFPPPPKEHPKPEIVQMGFEFGARLNYAFNESWSVSAGLTKRNERAILNIRKEIDYNKNDENLENINNQSYESTSSYGDLGVNVALERNAQFQPPNDEFPISLTLNGNQEKESLNIPLAVQYQRNIDKWSFGIRAGVSGQVVLDSKFKTRELTTNIPEITVEEVQLTRRPEISEKFSVDGLIGLSISYSLTDRWKLHVEPTHYKSFTDKHRSENGHVTSNTNGFQLGASYVF